MTRDRDGLMDRGHRRTALFLLALAFQAVVSTKPAALSAIFGCFLTQAGLYLLVLLSGQSADGETFAYYIFRPYSFECAWEHCAWELFSEPPVVHFSPLCCTCCLYGRCCLFWFNFFALNNLQTVIHKHFFLCLSIIKNSENELNFHLFSNNGCRISVCLFWVGFFL